jgi:Small-conductance mechanosensitive channel
MSGVELQLARLLTELGIEKENLGSTQKMVIITILIVLAFLADYLCRRIVVPAIKKITLKTQVKWDDYLFNDNFLNNCCHIIPPVFLSFSLPLVFDDGSDSFVIIQKLLIIYVIIISVRIICSFLSSLYSITSEYGKLKSHPLKGVYQMLKIVVISVGAIVIVANLLNKSPMSILTGLGASAAILMLIFKDSIMGLVAGIQLSANKMLSPGDWISMPKYGADGIVMEVTLTTVKVRNWDNTIITVPPYALVSDSFQNWRGMEQSDGRRVKCSVSVDMKTVRFCNSAELEHFKRKDG